MIDDRILLAHGSGGRLSHELVEECFTSALGNDLLNRLDDSAVFELSGRLAFTTDSFVVNPIFFPGGDIGKLAVCGTVNDLSMNGAVPLYLSLGFVIEEGLLISDLKKIIVSVRKAAAEAGVKIVTGDTKVVNRGAADHLFVNTSGIGVIAQGALVSGSNARVGDKIILNGPVGDHGLAVLSQREGLEFSIPIQSDCAPLNALVRSMLEVSPTAIHAMRDPTRGGLATTLNEIARQSKVGIHLREQDIPVRPAVRSACDLLGFDPLYVANEGKLVAMVAPEFAAEVLGAMRRNLYGREAQIIGEVTNMHPGRVAMQTTIGATRIVDMLVGELLPRIC